MISVIITAHNEGDELRKTVSSVRTSARNVGDVIVIDEASTDNSCRGLDDLGASVVRHSERVGVAASRHKGTRLARGQCFAFVDGHQRFSDGCLDECAAVARRHNAIVWPDVGGLGSGPHVKGGLGSRTRIKHGASFCLYPEENTFSATWKHRPTGRRISRITSLRCPGYVMSRSVYDQVSWIPDLRGWGGSEAAVSLKAFFLEIPILHLCGPLARHMFKNAFQYEVTSDEVWRNQALIAHVCFGDRAWFEYWLPKVFDHHLTDAMRRDLASSSVQEHRREFRERKVRTDREFWTMLVRMPVPNELRQTSVSLRSWPITGE